MSDAKTLRDARKARIAARTSATRNSDTAESAFNYNPLLQKPISLGPGGKRSGYHYFGPPPDAGTSYGMYHDDKGNGFIAPLPKSVQAVAPEMPATDEAPAQTCPCGTPGCPGCEKGAAASDEMVTLPMSPATGAEMELDGPVAEEDKEKLMGAAKAMTSKLSCAKCKTDMVTSADLSKPFGKIHCMACGEVIKAEGAEPEPVTPLPGVPATDPKELPKPENAKADAKPVKAGDGQVDMEVPKKVDPVAQPETQPKLDGQKGAGGTETPEVKSAAKPVKAEDVKPEDEKAKAEEEKKADEEAKAVQYEVLQSVDSFKDLAEADVHMTIFEEESANPYWNVDFRGQPVARIFLKDQPKPEEIRSTFCSAQYAIGVTGAIAKVGAKTVFKSVKAHLWANEVDKSNVTKSVTTQVEAKLKADYEKSVKAFGEKLLANIGLVCAGMDKNFYKDLGNPLKESLFVHIKKAGVYNPIPTIEAAFRDGATQYFDTVLTKAVEYLSLEPKALTEIKKAIADSDTMTDAPAEAEEEEKPVEAGDGAPVDAPTLHARLAAANVNLSSIPTLTNDQAQDLKAQIKGELKLRAKPGM